MWLPQRLSNLSPLKFEGYPLFLDDSNHANEADQSIGKAPVQLLVSLAAVPTLGMIVGLQAVLQQVQAMANSSEEIFRGDRLPLLPFPEPSSPSDAPTSS
jgi:hypothetical protein